MALYGTKDKSNAPDKSLFQIQGNQRTAEGRLKLRPTSTLFQGVK